MVTKIRALVIALALVFSGLIGTLIYATQMAPVHDAAAGAAVVGNKEGADTRLLISSGGDDRVKRVVYFKSESHASGGANTPVASEKVCGLSGIYHYAEVQFTGTLAGTNPTLAFTWQNSKDNGATWTTISVPTAWTTINATVTPATQKNTVSDHPEEVLMNANTPVVTPAVMYGDCFRVLYTMTGTGNPSGNFTVIGAEK